MIDHDKHRARHIVAELHDIADASVGALRTTLQDAAVLLDHYQAGHSLATPALHTGYRLVRVTEALDMQVVELAMEHINATEAGVPA